MTSCSRRPPSGRHGLDRAQRDVIEEALRRYLGLETTVRRIQTRGDLDEDESLALAHRELDAYRAERAKAM
jgi:hypothetical protein